MNDAIFFAVGEAWTGSFENFKKSIALRLGTGFGSAFIDSGIPVLEGADVPKLGCHSIWLIRMALQMIIFQHVGF